MAYYPPPSYGDATYMQPTNNNVNDNQGAQTPEYGDCTDMLNDNAFGGEDADAFVDAPEHQDNTAAPAARNSGGGGTQQQHVQSNVYGVAGADEAETRSEQRVLQQQMDDHGYRSRAGSMTAATHNFSHDESGKMDADDDAQMPQQKTTQEGEHGTEDAATSTWNSSRPILARENEGMVVDSAEEPNQQIAQDVQYGAEFAATATMDVGPGSQGLENEDMVMDGDAEKLPHPFAQNGRQDMDAGLNATMDVNCLALAHGKDSMDTDNNGQDPHQQTDQNGNHAVGSGIFESEVLNNPPIVGDAQPSIPASPPPPTKRIRHDPAKEPQGVKDISKDAGRDTYTAAYHAALAKKSRHSSQPESPQPHSRSIKVLECGHSPGAETPPESRLLEAPHSSGPAKPVPSPPTWRGPDPTRDVPRPIVAHKKWHDRVAPLHPDLYLAPHRYWVGVLNPATKPCNATKEEHFLWFKANRLTTIETVWQTYSAVTAEIDFSFFLAGEKVGLEEQLGELDICGDKIVIFKVIEDGESGEGRKVSEGLVPKIPEVIELD